MRSKSSAVWIVMLLAAAGVAAVAVYVRTTPTLKHEEPAVHAGVATSQPPPETHPAPKQQQTVTVYLPTMGPDGIAFTKQEATVPDGMDAKVFALNSFLHASEIAPDDAKVLGVDLTPEGLARVDCNPAFKQTYGSFDEKKMLDGVASVLGQFPDVKSFVFEVDNEPLKTLGSADLTEPVPVILPAAVPMKPTLSSAPTDTSPVKP